MSTLDAETNIAAPTGITAAAYHAALLMEAAELRGLPLPFAVDVLTYDPIRLYLSTRDEVVTWAEALEADVEDESHFDDLSHLGGSLVQRWHVRTAGEVLGISVRVVAVITTNPRSAA